MTSRRAEAATAYLQIPRADWPRLQIGEKTEFRLPPGRQQVLVTPTPVVLFTIRTGRRRDEALYVCEACWQEPLMAITAESLEREGYATVEEFRRYWRARIGRRGYRPLDVVTVHRLRRWASEDREKMGAMLLERLYGPWL